MKIADDPRKTALPAGGARWWRTGALAEHAWSGALGGVVLAASLVLVETVLLRVLWAGAVIAPHGLARTSMFDFLTELYALVQTRLGLAALPAAMGRVYLPDAAGLVHLLLDLARAALPVGMLLGMAVGVSRAAAGRRPSARAVVGSLALLGVGIELARWVTSVHVPVSGSVTATVRGAGRDFLFDGVLASLAVLALAGSAAAALFGRLARRPLPRRAGRTSVAIVLVGLPLGLWSAAHIGPRPPAPVTSPAADEVARRPTPPPNVLLISIDTLRADHLGCYGYPRSTSPRVDALAASGTRFARAWSTTSWTLPAHVSMLSGRSLLGHGVLGESLIPASVPMLAEVLRGAGYQTAAFVSAPYLSSQFGFARGFDLYDDFSVPFKPDRESRERAQATISAPLLHPSLERWLRATARSPFFLFVHYFDVHHAYRPPPPFDTMFDPDYQGSLTGSENFYGDRIRADMPARDLAHLIALYDGEIRFTDGYVGRALDLLEELGLADDTIVILTADHGEEFFEHGNKGHHRTLYEEVLHVPLVIAWPGHLQAGRVVTEPASIVDIVPTILELVGQPAQPGVEGASLVPQLRGEPGHPERQLVAEHYLKTVLNMQVAVRRGDRKLIQSLNFPHREFYNLGRDAGERHSLASGWAPTPLTEDLGRWLAVTWPAHRELQAERRQVALDAGRVDALRALGYVE
jgi:arylsulfatase A-like enzyme